MVCNAGELVYIIESKYEFQRPTTVKRSMAASTGVESGITIRNRIFAATVHFCRFDQGGREFADKILNNDHIPYAEKRWDNVNPKSIVQPYVSYQNEIRNHTAEKNIKIAADAEKVY